MKALAAVFCLTLLSAPVFAETADDAAACQAHEPELLKSVSGKAYEIVRNSMIGDLQMAYRQVAPINETQISFTSEKIDLVNFPIGIEVSLEANVNAGADSAAFSAVSRMPLAYDGTSLTRAFRDTEYDSIGRVVKTRLLCTLSNSSALWEIRVMNKATSHVIVDHGLSGDVSAQIELP